jgi:hypothetical protein
MELTKKQSNEAIPYTHKSVTNASNWITDKESS